MVASGSSARISAKAATEAGTIERAPSLVMVIVSLPEWMPQSFAMIWMRSLSSGSKSELGRLMEMCSAALTIGS
ncbi:hypothetical protein D3C86_2164710 [compost metagenome]